MSLRDTGKTEYLTLDEKMKAVKLHEKKLEMDPGAVSKRERALLQNTKDEIEKIFAWGKQILSSDRLLKAKMTDGGVLLTFKIKNTSGLEFTYIRIPILLYGSDGNFLDQIIFQKDNWPDGKEREIERILSVGVPARGSIDFRNLIYQAVQEDIPEEEDEVVNEDKTKAASDRTLILATDVAGTSYVENMAELEPNLQAGDELTLLREPGNKYDSMAILVLNKDGEKLGYVPRRDNRVIANLMDAGKQLSVVVTAKEVLNGYVKIQIDIYLQEDEEDE